MKNKLIELLDAFRELEDPHDGRSWTEHLADHLIAGGVVILDPKKYPPLTNGAIIKTICGEPLDDVADLIEAKREGRVIVPPCKVGQMVYKICPKCNDRHNGSCKNCAWSGCLGFGCDVGVRVCSDGSHNEHDLQIVPRKVTKYNILTIFELWNIQYFATEEEAATAMVEYDTIRKMADRHERYKAYKAWEAKRKTQYAFLEDEE